MGNVRTKGENFYRDAKKVQRLNILKEGKPIRDKQGNITQAASFQSRELPNARIEPNRKWFTNTRVISQEALTSFREAMEEKRRDPYQVLLKSNKLPMSLLDTKEKKTSVRSEAEPFSIAFGKNKGTRKKPKVKQESITDLAGVMEDREKVYLEKKETERLLSGRSGETEEAAADGWIQEAREPIFSKGQSKRIWNELYKVR